jgi:pimeloyl-ACP methyl ester carboxylesterase
MPGMDGVPEPVVETLVEVAGVPVSGLVSARRRPRAVVLALHGGAARAAYWDCPNHPELSFLRTAAALGHTAVALDRPGYGASYGKVDDLTADERADLTFAALDAVLQTHLGTQPDTQHDSQHDSQHDTGPETEKAALFLVGHSAGCELAVRMAADRPDLPERPDLLGLELASTGRTYAPRAAELLSARWAAEGGLPRPGGLRELLWEPATLYPPDLGGGRLIGARAPFYEGTVVEGWATRDLAELAARVRVPVHYTLADHEMVWQSGPEALADVAGLFTASSRVVAQQQDDSGHNLSVGVNATAYHLKVLSFVEECLAARRRGSDRELQPAAR